MLQANSTDLLLYATGKLTLIKLLCVAGRLELKVGKDVAGFEGSKRTTNIDCRLFQDDSEDGNKNTQEVADLLSVDEPFHVSWTFQPTGN